MVLSPDHRVLATGSTDSTVILWDVVQRKVLAQLITPSCGSVDSLAFSPDGRWLVTGHDDPTIRLWDVPARRLKNIYRGHEAGVEGVAFSPDGRSIISSSLDQTVKVWDAEQRSQEQILTTNRSWTVASNFSPDGRLMASEEMPGVFAIWDVPARRAILQVPGASGGGICAFSPNGEILAQLADQRIKLWDVRTVAPRGELTNGFAALSVSFTPDSQTLAAAGLMHRSLHGITDRLVFWNLSTRQRVNKLAAAAPLAAIVSFSSDGRMVALGYLDGAVRLWDYQSEGLMKEFTDQHSRIWSVTFSPDDTWLVAGGEDGKVVFYDVRARRALRPVTGTSTWIAGLCFTPDGKTLASAEGEGVLNLWNVATREVALTLKGHIGALSPGTAFSPDGNLLASSGADGTVRLWPAAAPNEIPQPKRSMSGAHQSPRSGHLDASHQPVTNVLRLRTP
jgi:WD40 repeat protein